MRKLYLAFYLFLIFFIINTTVNADTKAVIYKSESCGHCGVYIEELKNFLTSRDITDIVEKDIINNKNYLLELDKFTKDHNIPYDMQGHMVVIINSLVLEGHIPIGVLEDIFSQYPDHGFSDIVIFQDSMDPFVTEYKIMENNNIKECSTENSLNDCREKNETNKSFWKKSFFFIVAFNALLAGIHPCTLSVLLFFIAFLLMLRRSRIGILKVGISYIIGIFIAYFGIGLGIFKAVSFIDTPHFAAKIGAVLVLILGIITILSYLFPKKLSFGIPKFIKPAIAQLLEKSTIPAVFLVGILVGLCSFGCTAGIYLSVISLLLVQSEYIKGILYLILYNIMFILPLIIVLVIAVHKKIIEKIENLETKKSKYIKLLSGLIMIILAIIIFLITRS